MSTLAAHTDPANDAGDAGATFGVRDCAHHVLPDPVYQDELVTLYLADCRDVLGAIETRHGRPAHVITDPPYGERTQRGARSAKTIRKGATPASSFVTFSESEQFARDVIVAANASRWSIIFADHLHAAHFEERPPGRLRHVRTGVWIKPDCAPQFNGKCPANGHESISILHSAAPMRWNARGRRGVWTHGVERKVPWHPTPKPVGLLRELVRNFTDPGEYVIDTFGGSVAVAIACRAEGRRCVAIEIDPSYAAQGAQRLMETA